MMNSGGGVCGGLASWRPKRKFEIGSMTELNADAAVIVTISPHRLRSARPPCSATSGSQTPSGMPCQNLGAQKGQAR